MLIRIEIPIDAMNIHRLLQATFPTAAEAELVRELREQGLLTLGMVSCSDEGSLIGYAAFSPVMVMGEDYQWVGLAPVAVEQTYRQQDVAYQLITEGMNTLNEFGYGAIVTLGDPAYYQRFGFVPAARFGLYCQWSDCEEAFQICLLNSSTQSLTNITGLIDYSSPFDRF